MSLYWHDDIWWYEFTIERTRYRSSCYTTDRAVALKVEAEHRVSLKQTGIRASATMSSLKKARSQERCTRRWIQAGFETKRHVIAVPSAPKPRADISRTSTLPAACEFLLGWGSLRWAKKTMEYNRAVSERLIEFFGAQIKLRDFKITHFEHYQQSRSASGGAGIVNRELQYLGRLLTRVDLWHKIKRHYEPLATKDWGPPRIFTEDEQERIFAALAEDPELELGRIVFTLTRNTTASGCELRGLKLQSLDLEADPPRIHITRDSTKNAIRPRVIPLNVDALEACKLAVARAKHLGSSNPTDYLFPLRVDKATWDPKRRASSSWLRKQVERLRLVTGIEHINPHVFRHLAVTELLERGASEQTVVAIAGWSSPRMFATYSHARIGAKLEAVALLGPNGKKPKAPPDNAIVKSSGIPAGTQLQVDLMNAVVQAEIERQVAAQVATALEERERPRPEHIAKRPEGSSSRILSFPLGGPSHA